MTTDFFPKIGPKSYPLFIEIPANDFPKTFQEWDRMLLQKREYFQLQWHPNGSITNVEINPGEFTEFCRATKAKSTLEAIFRFAKKKGLGE